MNASDTSVAMLVVCM